MKPENPFLLHSITLILATSTEPDVMVIKSVSKETGKASRSVQKIVKAPLHNPVTVVYGVALAMIIQLAVSQKTKILPAKDVSFATPLKENGEVEPNASTLEQQDHNPTQDQMEIMTVEPTVNVFSLVMMELMLEKCTTKTVFTLLKLLGISVARLLLVKMALATGSVIKLELIQLVLPALVFNANQVTN